MSSDTESFHAVVIGSGFGGAVTACRLAQATETLKAAGEDFRVCLLERGRRWEPDDFPIENPLPGGEKSEQEPFALKRWLWRADSGLWDLRPLEDIVVGQAAGYGGGSLIYANVHLRPPQEVFAKWPKEFQGTRLNRYFELAAYNLQATPLPRAYRAQLAKTRQMQRAGSTEGDLSNLFYPPLAVRFAPDDREPQDNECDFRGHCCFGCPTGAKLTLDRTYLDKAESQIEIRTLAEVVRIKHNNSSLEKRFTVSYVSRLLDRPDGDDRKSKTPLQSIHAQYVFLCAGAINTTELLLRNAQHLHMRNSEHVGAGFFPNVDDIAGVFDTDQAHRADHGPTITAALLYRPKDGDSDDPWFMIQDGGAPGPIASMMGVLRSPLLFRRNRFLEPDNEVYPHRPAQLPAYEKFAKRMKLRDNYSWNRVLPNQLRTALLNDRREILDWLGRNSHEVIGHLLDRMAAQIAANLQDTPGRDLHGLQDLIDAFIETFALQSLFNDRAVLAGASGEFADIPRALLNLGTVMLSGSESNVARETSQVMADRWLPRDVRSLIEGGSAMLRMVLDYRVFDEHTAMLLTMGRDTKPWRIALESQQDVGTAALTARKPYGEDPVRRAQELALREIAKSWGGELRTNPVTAGSGKLLTVHSQGGCAMGVVTGNSGELLQGPEGIYVMDAAAFPASVGVNPSATIAAVAEFKVEQFIQRELDLEEWCAPECDEVQAWLDETVDDSIDAPGSDAEQTRRLAIDPLNRRPDPLCSKAKFGLKPIGLKFDENMTGFYTRHDSSQQLSDHHYQTSVWPGKIDVNLTARIDDFERFVHSYADRALGRRQPMHINVGHGTVVVSWNSRTEDPHGELAPGTYRIDPDTSLLRFFVPRPGGQTRRELSFDYELRLRPLDDAPNLYVIRGEKRIADDAGFDLWADTSTLYFRIHRLESAETGEDRVVEVPDYFGLLRIPLVDFFADQLRSIRATGTTDRARQSWTIVEFLKLFVTQLADVYTPDSGNGYDLIRTLVGR